VSAAAVDEVDEEAEIEDSRGELVVGHLGGALPARGVS
jgi:hypothetical protein